MVSAVYEILRRLFKDIHTGSRDCRARVHFRSGLPQDGFFHMVGCERLDLERLRRRGELREIDA